MITKDFEFDWYYDNWNEVHQAKEVPEGHLHCCIPFIGTYGAISCEINEDSYIDTEIEHFEYCEPNMLVKKLIMKFQLKDYIKDYVNYVADLLKVDSLKFNVMHSPREYNFTSDDLVCTISRDDAWKLYQKLDKDKYAEDVAHATTAVPGFFPFYKKEDFYFDSKEDLPVNNAALLSVLMNVAAYQALTEEYGKIGDNYDYELYLRFDEDRHVNDYYWFDEILADESDNIEAKADAKKSQI